MSRKDNPNLAEPDHALRPHRHRRSNADTASADDESTADDVAAAEIAVESENEDAATTAGPPFSAKTATEETETTNSATQVALLPAAHGDADEHAVIVTFAAPTPVR